MEKNTVDHADITVANFTVTAQESRRQMRSSRATKARSAKVAVVTVKQHFLLSGCNE